MKIKTLIQKRSFVLLVLIVTAIHFFLLRLFLQNGFNPTDDLRVLFYYKTFGHVGFLNKYLHAFYIHGLYEAHQMMYIGLLEGVFKGNNPAYHITNIIFKILATLSLYPLILVVFKRRLLAFLTTILYAISYSSTGVLMTVISGSEYLAIFFMNIFLLSYYHYNVTRKKILLFTATVLLFPSFMLAPIRMYQLLGFVILVEVFIWVKARGLRGFGTLMLRLLILFLPLLITFPLITLLIWPHSILQGQANSLLVVYKFLSHGNYQLLLTPLAGLGYTFLTNDIWPIFGQVTFVSFKNYLLFLLHGPVIIYSVLTILIGFLITKKPLRFILGIILANAVFELVSYFLITNVQGLSGPNVKDFYEISTYAIFFGFFITSIATASLWTWIGNRKKNILLLSLFCGPFFSSLFFWGYWVILGEHLVFKEGIHRYMAAATMGSSLFLATLMVLTFDKIKRLANYYLKNVLLTLLFLTILPIYLLSRQEINSTFIYSTSNTGLYSYRTGSRASDQEQMKSKLFSYIKEPLEKNPALFYFEAPDQRFYPISVLSGFDEVMHLRNWEIINGCIGHIYDRNVLEKSIVIKDGIKGFNVSSLCVENSTEVGYPEMFYKPENFYALRFNGKNVINIKERILKELNFLPIN